MVFPAARESVWKAQKSAAKLLKHTFPDGGSSAGNALAETFRDTFRPVKGKRKAMRSEADETEHLPVACQNRALAPPSSALVRIVSFPPEFAGSMAGR